jgi:hypothetical protein
VRAVFSYQLHCPACAQVRAFEQPPCAEQHEPVCPEWACISCGAAILLEPPAPRLLPVPRLAPLPRQRDRRLAA